MFFVFFPEWFPDPARLEDVQGALLRHGESRRDAGQDRPVVDRDHQGDVDRALLEEDPPPEDALDHVLRDEGPDRRGGGLLLEDPLEDPQEGKKDLHYWIQSKVT